ncbi:hypothetical protein F5Y01DRAFT_103740 [Xylaria sp. FL0043]|nr:hypothetical protein F5Y01DRAFT_103740 [Xylaria sp. FL0043]
MASTQQQDLPPAYTSSPSKPSTSPENTLHKYWSTTLLAFLFLVLLVLPWVFLSILNVRPIGGQHQVSSWHDVSGKIGEEAVHSSQDLYRASGVLLTVAAVLTFPVLSALLNHAAVVVVQRRHPDQRLNASQMLYLADAPWSRLPATPKNGAPRTAFTYGARALIVLGFIPLILQSALVTWEEVRVATYNDAPNNHYYPDGHYDDKRYSILRSDATPERIARLPIGLVTKEVTARMSSDSRDGAQPQLWDDAIAPFAAAFPTGVDTGVLRYHAMRLNTSVQCEAVSRDSFPEICPGPMPFYGSLSLPSRKDEDDDGLYGLPNIQIRWCVPGNASASPWSITRDRQDIAEDMFVDVLIPRDPLYADTIKTNFTTRCSANTTRGYFELPNSHNNFTHGPLLDKWVSAKGRASVTNDVDDLSSGTGYLDYPYLSNYPYSNDDQLTPGPLTTAMISMLGNESWMQPLQNISESTDPSTLYNIYRSMCTGGIPFLTWEDDRGTYGENGFSTYEFYCRISQADHYGPLTQIKQQAHGWFNFFSETAKVNSTLASAAFFANEAVLTRSGLRPVDGVRWDDGVIYTSPGVIVHKPSISLPAEIVISVLLGAEVLAIILLVLYIRHKPTFTDRLDALVVATIGAQLSAAGMELPQLHENKTVKRYQLLREHDGVIGLSHGSLTDEEVNGSSETTNGSNAGNFSNGIELASLDEPQPSKVLIVGGIGSLR